MDVLIAINPEDEILILPANGTTQSDATSSSSERQIPSSSKQMIQMRKQSGQPSAPAVPAPHVIESLECKDSILADVVFPAESILGKQTRHGPAMMAPSPPPRAKSTTSPLAYSSAADLRTFTSELQKEEGADMI